MGAVISIPIIEMLYTDFSAQVICSNSLTDTFEIKTGVKQGCILSLDPSVC